MKFCIETYQNRKRKYVVQFVCGLIVMIAIIISMCGFITSKCLRSEENIPRYYSVHQKSNMNDNINGLHVKLMPSILTHNYKTFQKNEKMHFKPNYFSTVDGKSEIEANLIYLNKVNNDVKPKIGQNKILHKRSDVDENQRSKTDNNENREFDLKTTSNSFSTAVIDTQLHKPNDRILAQCYLPHSSLDPFHANYIDNQLIPLQSVNNLYVLGQTRIPYNPYVSAPYQNPGYFAQSTLLPLNPSIYYGNPFTPSNYFNDHVINTGGQFYICNPTNVISKPSLSSIPSVEIRRTAQNNDLQVGAQIRSESAALNDKVASSILCPKGQRMCNDGAACIDESHFCDNEVNCLDASDEMNCSCKSRVGTIRLCDGYQDCPEGEDEQDCYGCADDEYSCDDWSKFRNATCIPIFQRCDGQINCHLNERDELDCVMLIDSIRSIHNEISSTFGFLHRNYKGIWYPVCSGNDIWALDVCRSETVGSKGMPNIQSVKLNDNRTGQYLTMQEGVFSLVDNCKENSFMFIKCPTLVCGMRNFPKNLFRNAEVDTSEEGISINELNNQHGILRKRSNIFENVGSERVVGGRPCQPGAWPWVVSINRNGIFHCGGVIINELWILTAAHCVHKHWQYYYEIHAGVLRRFSFTASHQYRFASIIISHQDYKQRTLTNDIALIKLSLPLHFNLYVRPICLPTQLNTGNIFVSNPIAGSICTAVGWGATIEHGADPDNLREVEVPILSHCKHIEDQRPGEICAGLIEGGRDACQGDSGGPLLCRTAANPVQWYVAGIVSHGEGCARPNEPGVYTKVERYIGWILDTIGSDLMPANLPLQECPGYNCLANGQCLAQRRRCDKIIDCMSGDDEFNCEISPLQELFLQSNHLLGVAPSENGFHSLVHNLLKGNKSETAQTEINNKYNVNMTTSASKFFTCTRLWQIIPLHFKCDKIFDCEDGTDEDNCVCVDYLKVLHPGAVCNGIIDCFDLTDEQNCELCTQDEFYCYVEKNCIPLKNRCDGFAHCSDMEDELDCVVLSPNGTVTTANQLVVSASIKGFIIVNQFGKWNAMCSDKIQNEALIANSACNLLGLQEYAKYFKKPLRNNSTTDPSINFTNTTSSIRCNGLYVTCSNVSVNSYLNIKHLKTTIIKQYNTVPWNAIIFINGIFTCMGSLLSNIWIVASSGCFAKGLKRDSRIVAILGKGMKYFDIPGPFDQVIDIVQAIPISDTDITLLQLVENVQYNRYTLPIMLAKKSYFKHQKEHCVTTISCNRQTKVIQLSVSAKCSNQYRCFQTKDAFQCNVM